MWSVISALCTFVALAGCVCALYSVLVVRRFAFESRPPHEATPAGITVLKPLHGAESKLYENLLSFLSQDYPGPVQVIFGVSDAADEALPVVRRLFEEFPDRDLGLSIGTRTVPGNAKIANLIGMSALIRHELIVMSDSDIRVESDYLRRASAALSQPGVGLVTCLYRGEPDRGPWAQLSSMAIDYHFLPAVLLAIRLDRGRPCFGATMAFSKQTLEAIGGFRAFANYLADDHAIGEAVRASGQRVIVGPHVVAHLCAERSAAELFHHELRWARTIRSIDPLGFAGSFITYPIPFALAAAMLGGFDAVGSATLLATVLCRVALQWQIENSLRLATWRWALGPLRDILSFFIFCAAFLTDVVVWRGHRYRIRANGTMEALKGSKT